MLQKKSKENMDAGLLLYGANPSLRNAAASRFYYGAFQMVYSYAEKHRPEYCVYEEGDGGVHRKMIDMLEEEAKTDHNFSCYGRKLRNIKIIRNVADYDKDAVSSFDVVKMQREAECVIQFIRAKI